MQFIFVSPGLTQPTVETLREYAQRKLSKLGKVLPSLPSEHVVRVSVQKQRHIFTVQVEVTIPQKVLVQVEDLDLRAAIDRAYQSLKIAVVRQRERKQKQKRI